MKTEDDDFRDMAPLRPSLDADRWTRMIDTIEQRAAPELARRANLAVPGVLDFLVSWRRPVFTSALVAATLAGIFVMGGAPAPTEGNAGLVDALGYPAALSDWVETGWVPSVEEVLVAMEGEA